MTRQDVHYWFWGLLLVFAMFVFAVCNVHAAPYLGDYVEDETVFFKWSTAGANGASITRATNGTVSVYKDGSDAQSTAGVTDTEDFDGLTGVHHCAVDTSADAFYATGADYTVVLSAATIDGQVVNAPLAHFSIQNRYMRGTDSAFLAASAPTNFSDLAITSGTGRVTVGTNADKTGYSISGTLNTLDGLDTAQDAQHAATQALLGTPVDGDLAQDVANVQAAIDALENISVADVWAALTSGLTTAGSIGKLLVDNVNATIASRSSHSAGDAADAVWDEAATGHTDAGKAGAQLWTDIDAILADTNELQSDDVPGLIAAAEANIRGADSDDLKGLSDQIDAASGADLAITGSVDDVTPAAGGFDGNAELSATNDFYNGSVLAFTSGTLKGLGRRITDYVGASKTFSFAVAFPAAPSNGDTFEILGRIDE